MRLAAVDCFAYDLPLVEPLRVGDREQATRAGWLIRVRDGDAISGKRTLAVRFGRTFARWEYTACILGATCVPLVLVRYYGAPPNVMAAAMIVLAAISALKAVWTATEAAVLNSLLAYTALLLLLYAMLFAVGWNL